MKSKLIFLLLCAGTLLLSSCSKNDSILSSDLTATISASDQAPVVGTNITFTIVAHNNGPDNATGVDVTNNLPTGYTIVSSNATAGTVGARAWTIGSLANGASATLTLVATVLPTGTYPFTVSILGVESDPSTSNNSGLATVVPKPASVSSTDLSITINSSDLTPVVGTNLTFTIEAHNNGPDNATLINVTDNLPTGYTLVSATPSVGTIGSTGWTIGSLANGTSATLTMVVTVLPSGSYPHAVSISGAEADPSASNNSASVTVAPKPATSAKITYDNDIKPLLVASCTPCHVSPGGYQKKWDVYATAKANITNIISRVSKAKGSAGFMPQGGEKLSDSNIALLNQWVTDGLLEK